ncbi:Conserved_hypothetical protein [Hexamita inflata]|uniref:Uncharacterized protein n=1 Tax=Hexamita inflata TaxID=28002 RepID=A0AA86N491_9EUKA|nr:Conserved hypothetical protein [Hexamita inflata]
MPLLFRHDNTNMSICKCVRYQKYRKCTITEVRRESQGYTIKQQCISYHYNFRKHRQILEFIKNDLNYIQKDTQLNSQNFAFPAAIAHSATTFVTLIFGDLRTNLQCARETLKTQYFLGAQNPLETRRKQLECKTSTLSKNVPAEMIKTHQFNSCRQGVKMTYNIILYKQILFRNSSRMLSSILLLSQVKQQLQQLCTNNLVQNGKQFTFCQKAVQINQQNVDSAVHVSEKSGNIFLYTELTKDSNMSFQVSHVNSFAVFGFNMVDKTVTNCTVNISIDYHVVQAALICLQCDLIAEESVFVFIASGQYLSGVMLMSQNYIILNSTQVQTRLNSSSASGIVNKVPAAMTNFTVQDCILTAYFWLTSSTSGYISSIVQVPLSIIISYFNVCANAHDFGSSNSIIKSMPETQNCESICVNSFYTYGLCLQSLYFGVLNSFTLQCVNDFQFNGQQCVCKNGFMLNGTECVNIVNKINVFNAELQKIADNLNHSLKNGITDKNEKVDLNMKELEERIIKNSSQSETKIIKIFEEIDKNLARNTSQLEKIIVNNNKDIQNLIKNIETNTQTLMKNEFDEIERQILSNYTKMDINLKDNTIILDGKIQSNYTFVDNTLNSNTFDLENRIKSNFSQVDFALNSNISTLDTKINFTYTDLLKRISDNRLASDKLLLQTKQYLEDNITATMRNIASIYLNQTDYMQYQKDLCDTNEICSTSTQYQKRIFSQGSQAYIGYVGCIPLVTYASYNCSMSTSCSGSCPNCQYIPTGWVNITKAEFNLCTGKNSAKNFINYTPNGQNACFGQVANGTSTSVNLCQSTTVNKYKRFHADTGKCDCL